MQQAGSNARARSRIAGHAVARCHIGISTVIDIQQSALSAFKQQIRATQMRFIQFTGDVGHHGLEQFSVSHGLVKNRLKQHFSIRHIR